MGKIVIATTTCYESVNTVRAKLALSTVKTAINCGHQIVIVDNSDNFSVEDKLQIAGAVVYREEKPGMGNSRRQVFKRAEKMTRQDDIIVWMEPEKTPIVPYLRKMAETLINQKADLLIPRRKSLESYPLLQQHFEYLNNLAFYLLTGLNFDYCSGVRVFKKYITKYFLEYDGKYGDLWEILLIPIVRLCKDGKKIIEVEVDYIHPKKQTAQENELSMLWPMFEKRLTQLLNTVNSLKGEFGKNNQSL